MKNSLKTPGGFRAWILALALGVFFLAIASPELNRPGLHYDEIMSAGDAVLFLKSWGMSPEARGEMARRISSYSFTYLFNLFPWMTISYVGALKTYLFAAAFVIFGISLATVRWVNLILGASAVVFTTLAADALYGVTLATALGLLLATDPTLLIMSRHDWGCSILTMSLKSVAIYLLISGFKRESIWKLLSAGFVFGLCLWDKSHFAWFAAAASASAAVFAPRLLRRGRNLAAILGGFLSGASPFILFNILYGMPTLGDNGLLVSSTWNRWRSLLGEAARERWFRFTSMFSGSGYYYNFSQRMPPEIAFRDDAFRVLCGLAIVGILIGLGRRDLKSLRHAGFWALALAGTLLAAFLTPLNVTVYHLTMTFPLPQFALLSAIAAGSFSDILGRRKAAVGLIALATVLAAGNLTLMRAFYRDIRETGGSPVEDYVGLEELAKVCEQDGGPVGVLNWIYQTPLVIYSAGRIMPERVYERFENIRLGYKGSPDPIFHAKGYLLVSYRGPYFRFPSELPAKQYFDHWRSKVHPPLKLLRSIPYSDGTPWTDIYKVPISGEAAP